MDFSVHPHDCTYLLKRQNWLLRQTRTTSALRTLYDKQAGPKLPHMCEPRPHARCKLSTTYRRSRDCAARRFSCSQYVSTCTADEQTQQQLRTATICVATEPD